MKKKIIMLSIAFMIAMGRDVQAVKPPMGMEQSEFEQANTPLMQAIKERSLNKVRALIGSGADVNESSTKQFPSGTTPLMLASALAETEIMKELIKACADVNAVAFMEQPHPGRPVLRYALDSGSLAAINVLLDAFAQQNVMTGDGLKVAEKNPAGAPLLSYAISRQMPIEVIKRLIKYDVVNAKALGDYWTPLMVAAYFGYADAVNELLNTSGLDKKSDSYTQAINYARQQKHDDIATLLESKKNEIVYPRPTQISRALTWWEQAPERQACNPIENFSYPELEVIRQANQADPLIQEAFGLTPASLARLRRDVTPEKLAAKKVGFDEQVKSEMYQNAKYPVPSNNDVLQRYSYPQLEFARTFTGDSKLLEYALNMKHGALDVVRSLTPKDMLMKQLNVNVNKQ